MGFQLKVKKHPYYLYISIFLIALFFIGNSLISNKITSTTKNLNEFIVQKNIKEKYNTLKFEFNKLNNPINNAEKLIKTSAHLPNNKLKEKLLFIAELAILDKNIDNSFLFFIKDSVVKSATFLNNNNTNYRKKIISRVKNSLLPTQDTIVTYNNIIYNRKIAINQLESGTKIVFGYDVNLLKYWKHFSENQLGDGSYIVLTNSKGVCLLHPDFKYIGVKVDSFFRKTSPNKITENALNYGKSIKVESLIRTKVISEFLNLEVFRYFKTITTGNEKLILMVNFPINISVKESITNVKQYFLWMSILALCTFMLLLGIVRLQLRKEFSEKLKYEKERERLAISNEKIKQENATLQLNQLKKKMNPHFLFNSLNSLLVLIDINTELSQKFVQKLADVYRYFLEDRDGNLITVKEELKFLEHYFFLHKIRFKDSLNLQIIKNCNDKCLTKKIPFLALETLVENAIKHNEATKQNPLFIEILINNKLIIVSNNYNPRKTKKGNSHHIGLNYLKNSYQYYKINSFKTEIIDKKFKCYLPLLS